MCGNFCEADLGLLTVTLRDWRELVSLCRTTLRHKTMCYFFMIFWSGENESSVSHEKGIYSTGNKFTQIRYPVVDLLFADIDAILDQ